MATGETMSGARIHELENDHARTKNSAEGQAR